MIVPIIFLHKETIIPIKKDDKVENVRISADWLGAFQDLHKISRAEMKRLKSGDSITTRGIDGIPVVYSKYGSSLHIWPAPSTDLRGEVCIKDQ